MNDTSLIKLVNCSLEFKETKRINIKKGGSKKLGQGLVLKDINLELEKSKVYGVIGQNGSGKSTLLRVIFDLLKPTRGDIYRNFNKGKLLESPTFFHDELSSYDNLIAFYILNDNDYDLTSDKFKRLKLSFESIARLNEDDLNKPIINLSKGMRAKVGFGLTMAFLNSIDFIGLDEFFTFGDDAYREFTSNFIKKEINNIGSAILVSHSLRLIESICDKVILINNGKIINIDNPANAIREYQKILKK